MDHASNNSTFLKSNVLTDEKERPFANCAKGIDKHPHNDLYDVPKLTTTSKTFEENLNLNQDNIIIKIDDMSTEGNVKKDEIILEKSYEDLESPVFGKTFGKHLNVIKLDSHGKVGKKHSKSAGDLKAKHSIDKELLTNNGNLYLNVNDYQTFFGVNFGGSSNSSINGSVGDEGIHEKVVTKHNHKPIDKKSNQFRNNTDYDEETLKALRRVTRKFDSFRMRQLRARCFNIFNSDSLDEILENGEKSPNEKSNKCVNDDDEDAKLLNVLRLGNKDTKCNDFNRVSYAASQLLSNSKNSNDKFNDNEENKISDQSNSKEMIGNHKKSSLTLSGEEIDRIEFFYSSLGCETYVASCVVDVLVSVRTGNFGNEDSSPYRWVQVWVGVPVLILDIGIESRRPRKLTIALAERDTGMPLWQEKVSYSTDYRQAEGGQSHLLNESSAQSRILKIRWSDLAAADKFLFRYRLLTNNQNDPLWLAPKESDLKRGVTKSKATNEKPPTSPFNQQKQLKDRNKATENADPVTKSYRKLSTSKGKKSGLEKRVVYKKRIQKQDISVPFHVKVVTRVDGRDSNFKTTFAGLLPVNNKNTQINKTSTLLKKSHDKNADRNEDVCDFRPRLPTN